MRSKGAHSSSKRCLMLRPGDSVALALEDLKAGDLVELGSLKVRIVEPVDFGHKFAVKDIKEDEDVLKHGEVIGRATKDIRAGSHVHIHNIRSLRAGAK